MGWPSLVGWYGTGGTAQEWTGRELMGARVRLDWEDSVDRGSGWSSTNNPTETNVQAAGQNRNEPTKDGHKIECKYKPHGRRPGWLRWEFLEVTIDRLSDPPVSEMQDHRCYRNDTLNVSAVIDRPHCCLPAISCLSVSDDRGQRSFVDCYAALCTYSVLFATWAATIQGYRGLLFFFLGGRHRLISPWTLGVKHRRNHGLND